MGSGPWLSNKGRVNLTRFVQQLKLRTRTHLESGLRAPVNEVSSTARSDEIVEHLTYER